MDQILTLNPIGFVTKDPELHVSGRTDTKYLHLTIAVDKGYGKKATTLFFQSTFYGEAAERVVHAKVKKGSCIQLSGDIEDVVAFAKEGSGELLTMIKLDPQKWCYSPFAARKDGTKGPAPAAKPETPPVNPDDFDEVVCGDDGTLPD